MVFNFFKKKFGKKTNPNQDTDKKQQQLVEPQAAEPEAVEQQVKAPMAVEPQATEPEVPETQKSTGLFSKLKKGLTKTRQVLTTDINELFGSSKSIDEALFEELEELLITSDLGIDVTMKMMDKIRKKAKKLSTANELKNVLKEELTALFPAATEKPEDRKKTKPHIIMVVGVNGTGKTTTLGKLASKFNSQGNKVLIAAADTFRAAAIEQVEIWANRSNASIVKHKEGADPAAVAYDAVEAACARNVDIVLIDTAGRLHTQKNLMEELKKIKRSVNKKLPGAPHEVLMVLDSTTGQNAISQATLFNEAVGLTQIALTKLDGTAKGGIVASIANTMKIPITYIGVGENIEDLQDFDSTLFINALFD